MGTLDEHDSVAFDNDRADADQRVFGEFAVQRQFSVVSSQLSVRGIVIIALRGEQ